MKKWVALAMVALWMAFTAVEASAASVTLPASAKTAWDKLVSGSDSAQAAKLKGQYNELVALQQQETGLDERTKSLHYANAEALADTRNKIKQINASKLASLEAQAKQTRERYQPLLDKYTQLNKQISAAKAVKSKELAKVLQLQADLLKPSVQAAKAAIKQQDDAYKAEKDATSKIAKNIRATLDGIDTVNVRIRASKSSASASKSAISPIFKTLAQTAKQGDAKSAASSMSGALSLYRQLIGHKEKIYGYEQEITSIIAKAKTQFPKP